jgi:two-component system, sensor histidine kinase and response regulator
MPAAPVPRLLIVDDEAALMAALRDTLREEGYRVTGVTSGAEALAALKRSKFDLVLTDLVMPRMDGIALLGGAFAMDPFLVAIIMTGHGSIPTAVEAMKTGAIDYVLKPIKLTALLPALGRALTLRSLRIKNAQLEKSLRENSARLEAANQELEAFSFSVSHDLRMPLRTIAGFAEILLRRESTTLQPDDRRKVELIRAGADEMSELINGLLALSRFGRQALVPERVDIELLFQDAFRSLEDERKGRRVEIRIGPLPRAFGDPLLLRQAIVNLASNALKYSRMRDPAVVEVGADSPDGKSDPVYFIRDNGIGFDPLHAEKLFGVFQRLRHAHEFEGTGVGLAIVQRIIERHGGRVWAESAPDAGATFRFTLPASSASIAGAAPG